MFRVFCALFLALASVGFSWAQAPSPGAVDAVFYDAVTGQVRLHGWTRGDQDGHSTASFELSVGGISAQISQTTQAASESRQSSVIQKSESNDEKYSFNLVAEMTQPLRGGLSSVDLVAVLAHGQRVSLRDVNGSMPQVHVPKIYARHGVLLAIVLLVIIGAYMSYPRQAVRRLGLWVDAHTMMVTVAVLGLFVLLVASGVTGSSLRILLQGPFGQAVVETQGSESKVFKLRGDRGDEWGVITPDVLAQLHHEPRFPVVNTHLGLEGQNMGVVGMTGVPIAQPAALARPATWGYFFLPLRQALAWQWQLPFWGCFLAVWCLLNVWVPQSRGRNLALSFMFCVAPYAAAWSNWPLYATLFPAVALVFATRLCTTHSLFHGLLAGLALGGVLTAWVLVLYPPWLITVGTLCAVLSIGWVLDHRSMLQLRKPQVIGAGAAFAVAVLLLGSWWLDTRDAVALMKATEYPGARTTLTGGSKDFLWFFRGYLNPEVITFGTGPWTNQPEASSYFWMPLSIAWLCVVGWFREQRNRWTVRGCALFIAFYFYFRFVGVPLWLAEISLWGHVPTNRLDLSLGLAMVVLLALVRRDWFLDCFSGSKKWLMAATACMVLVGSLWVVHWVLTQMPVYVFPKGSVVYLAAIMVAVCAMSLWQLQGRIGASVAMLSALYLVSSLGFNPLSRAPRQLELAPAAAALASQGQPGDRLLRTLVVGGEGIGPLTLAAVGVPLVNGVLYYPHRSLWQQLDLPPQDWPVVNRYQHLGFTIGTPSNGRSFSVASPVMDRVVVTLDPTTFDFSRTGAQRVAALEADALQLRQSPMLKELGMHRGLVWFAVRKEPGN